MSGINDYEFYALRSDVESVERSFWKARSDIDNLCSRLERLEDFVRQVCLEHDVPSPY